MPEPAEQISDRELAEIETAAKTGQVDPEVVLRLVETLRHERRHPHCFRPGDRVRVLHVPSIDDDEACVPYVTTIRHAPDIQVPMFEAPDAEWAVDAADLELLPAPADSGR